MQSAFSGLNTALLAVMAQRKALEVSAHNVANANTEGYTRQEAVMEAVYPARVVTTNGFGQVGSGVDVRTIRRMRDTFLDYQIRGQTWSLGGWETARGYLEEIETIFNEPSESGLNSLLGKMWGAWQDLSASPESYVARAAVIQNAGLVADALRRDASQLDELQREAGQHVRLKVGEIGGWLEQVAELNDQIKKVRVAGDQGNDLADRRDLLLDQLARALKVRYQDESDGSVTLWLGDAAMGTEQRLVEGSRFHGLRVDGDSGIVLWDDGDAATDDPPAMVEDGELRAMLRFRDQELDPRNREGLAGRLDALAGALIAEVNKLHAPDGVGESFFVGAGAADIALNPHLESDPGLIRAGSSGKAGDGTVALAIAQLQTEPVLGGGTATIGDAYNILVARLGVDTQQAKTMATNQSLLVDHLARNREAFSGVSLDEEAASMIRFERAFQAAARVMTAMDEMLDRIINGMGVVGR